MPVIWKLFLKHRNNPYKPGQILPAGGTVTTEMASSWLPSHFFSLQKEIHSFRCPCFLGKMCVTMNVTSRSVFCRFFASCQDSCEPVIISGVVRITSPGPTSAPGPGGGEGSGSGSQALAAGWMWLDPGESFTGSWERGGVSPPVCSLLSAMGPVQQFQRLNTWAPSSSHPLRQLRGREEGKGGGPAVKLSPLCSAFLLHLTISMWRHQQGP